LNKPWWHRIDFSLILTTVTLIFIGLVMISSASGNNHFSSPEVRRQFTYFMIGFLLLVLFTAIDYEFWGRTYTYILVLNIVLLAAVMIFGHTVKGAQRWVSLGPLGTFQPSETAKLATIIILAKVLTINEILKIQDIIKACLYVGIPWLLILIQPDLGTALVLIAVALAMFYAAGIRPWILISTVLAGLLAAPLVLKDYQKRRLLTFINPEGDPEGSGWNLIQAKIAIGSGKIWGKGIFLGTQNQLNFVPEHSTDFIFTVIGEELGMVGAVGIIFLYFYLLWQGLSIAQSSRDSFGTLLAVGIVAMMGFHIVVNIGMTLGIMPVAGIPLPFISYGGSSLLTNMMAMGILGSIHFRRRKIF
jgi:rod shape determining protein RodA